MVETALLTTYQPKEKEAYIGVIASIATADRCATKEELDYLAVLSDAAAISRSTADDAAKDSNNTRLTEYLSVLKKSDLRFSLIADIISFAQSDGKYTVDEEEKIKSISSYLGITEEQTKVLSSVLEKSNAVVTSPEDGTDEGFFERSGFTQMLSNANIPITSLVKGLLGLAAPFILSKMVSNKAQSGSLETGGLGGGLGGTLLGNLQGGRIGGLGSILANLSGEKEYGGFGSILKRAIQ
jgi:uncharacterized tellurite resistance protein B-like protein